MAPRAPYGEYTVFGHPKPYSSVSSAPPGLALGAMCTPSYGSQSLHSLWPQSSYSGSYGVGGAPNLMPLSHNYSLMFCDVTKQGGVPRTPMLVPQARPEWPVNWLSHGSPGTVGAVSYAAGHGPNMANPLTHTPGVGGNSSNTWSPDLVGGFPGAHGCGATLHALGPAGSPYLASATTMRTPYILGVKNLTETAQEMNSNSRNTWSPDLVSSWPTRW